MEHILEKLQEIKQGEVGAILYSPLQDKNILSLNTDLMVPLASAAKVAVAFCIVKLVEEKKFKWTDMIQNIKLHPKEDSDILYPHYQNRPTLMLQEAVEVMIACHDSYVANCIVEFCGGWDYVNKKIQTYFNEINVSKNPKDLRNEGKLSHILELLKCVIKGYETEPGLWAPLVNGLVRQRSEIKKIPNHLINHMTGGLENAVIDIEVIGEFSKEMLIYVLGAKDLPKRDEGSWTDKKLEEALYIIYGEYVKIKNSMNLVR